MIKLIEVEPGKWRVDKPRHQPKRSDLPLPFVISDIMDPVEQVDGRFYTSKREYRAVGRANGLIEIGNEKLKPKTRASDDRAAKEKRRASLKTAVAKFRAGHRS